MLNLIFFIFLVFSQVNTDKTILKNNNEQITVNSSDGTVEIPVIIKGTCRFIQVPGGVKLIDDVTGKLLAGSVVEVEYKDKKLKSTVNSSGFLKLEPGRLVNLYFNGSELYAPCAYEGTVRKIENPESETLLTKYNVTYFIVFLLIVLIILQNFNYIKDEFNKIKVRKEKQIFKNESEKYEANYVVHTSSKLFLKNLWTVYTEDWITQKPLRASVKIYFSDGSEVSEQTDRNGKIQFEGKVLKLKIEKHGYKNVFIKPSKQGGSVNIKLISSRDWALLLFKDLCKRVMPDKAGKLTPAEALDLKIPPEDLIEELEKAVYGNKIPSEEDLKRFAEKLTSENKKQ